jgi:hypothetical protein
VTAGVAPTHASAPPAEPRPPRPDRAGAKWAALILAAALTCSVALANRFPLTYYDSASYLKKAYAFSHAARPLSLDARDYHRFQPAAGSPFTNPFFYRPPPYSVFLLPFASPLAVRAVPFAQGLLAALVVALALRTAGLDPRPTGLVLLFLFLSTLTSLPWYTGQIMPDVFTGLVILLAYLTVWTPERLRPGERAAALAMLAFTLSVHLSHLPLYAGLVLTGFAWRRWVDRARIAGALVLRALAPLAVAAAALVASNVVFGRRLVLSESSSLFYLARLVGDGTAQRYLARACAARSYVLCSERGNLPESSDHFLWDGDGAWTKHQNDPRFLAEAPEIVRGTLREEWGAQLAASLRNGFAQLGAFGSDLDLHASEGQVAPLMALFGAGTLAAYHASLQARRSLPLEAAGRVQRVVVVLSLMVLLACVPRLRARASGPARALVAVTLAGVTLNALVLGALSSVHDRYQGRVIWLVPLMAAALLARSGIGAPRRGAA